MSIVAICGSCQKKYKLPDEWAGKTAKCKACGQPMKIPAAGGASQAVSATAPSRAAGCPMCESPMAGGVCTVCGYSEGASKTLTIAPVVAGTSGGSKPRKKETAAGSSSSGSSTSNAAQWITIGSIAGIVVLVLVMGGALAMKLMAEKAKKDAHQRLIALMIQLHDDREASYNQYGDFDNDIDLKALLADGAAALARDLPHLPSFIEDLESKENEVAADRKRWIRDLIKDLPPGTDLAPLREIPSNSFAYEPAQERLKSP